MDDPTPECCVAYCAKPAKVRGRCQPHYNRWFRSPDFFPRGPLSEADRFWPKVDKAGPAPCHRPDLGPCWAWTFSHDEDGYGVFGLSKKRKIRAHKWAWEAEHEPVPDGLELDHFACDWTGCCNPAHVRPVTHKENMARSRPATKTHCAQGHPFSGGNLYVWRGKRKCRTCKAAYAERVRASRRRPPKSECVNGHPFDEANTRITPQGFRECRACHRDRERERWRAKRARTTEPNPATVSG